LLIVTNHARKVNNGLIAVWSRANDQGAWEIGFRPLPNLNEAFQQYEAVYIAAADPVGDDPSLMGIIRNAGFVVVQDLFLTETARLADVILPAQPFIEREGTFTSGERRVQRFYPGVVRNEFRPDYAITGAISKLVGVDVEVAPLRIFTRLAAKVPTFKDLSFRLLAQVTDQWPIVGRGDIYYGGTLYANAQGLGVQLLHPDQMPLLVWPQVPEVTLHEGKLLAVPITILYDRGQTVMPSELLKHRIPLEYIVVHPDEAARFNLMDGNWVHINLDGITADVILHVNEQVPPGVALVPRSLRVSITSPTPIELKSVVSGKM
jgi:NADH-quinone oxidoreductase subunit G